MRCRPILIPAAAFMLAVVLSGLIAAPAQAANVLDNVLTTYKNAGNGWHAALFPMAKSLFAKLALIEFLWFGIWFVIERDDPRQFMVGMLRKLMGLCFFFAILTNFDTWVPQLIAGFVQAGQEAASATTTTGDLSPSTVLDRGLEVATAIPTAAADRGLLSLEGLGSYMLAGLTALLILLCFAIIAGQLLVTLIESYIVVSAGVLFLGFAGSRWTTSFAEKFLSYAVSVGVKLFVTYLIIGAGQSLSNDWAGKFATGLEVQDFLEVCAGAITYVFLAWQIPALASSMMSGSVSMTLGSAMATAGTTGAAALGGMGVAAAGINSVAGAAHATQASLAQASARGATSLPGIAAGAMGAMASGIGSATADSVRGLSQGTAGGNLASRINDTTASIREANAAGGVDSPSVPGGAASPPAPSMAAAPSSSGAAPAASGSAAAAPAGQGAPEGPGGSANASSPQQAQPASAGASAASAAESAPAADPSLGQAPATPPQAEAQPTRATPPAPPAPARPLDAERRDAFEVLAAHAEALGKTPNDAAGSTGIQINLKYD